MVREIVKDETILQTVSTKADIKSEETQIVVRDLIDTANAHKESGNCVGLAAIQIGVPTRILVVFNGNEFVPIVNPRILRFFGTKYEAEEGCMSLDGVRKVKRSYGIEIMRETKQGFVKERHKGFKAQILQHEIDHLNGKLI